MEAKTKKLVIKDKKKLILSISLIVLAVIIIVSVVLIYRYFKFKPYVKYEEKMKTYGLDKMYNNGSAKTSEFVNNAEAIKLIIAAIYNQTDISGIAKPATEEYTNAIWIQYAQDMKIAPSDKVNKNTINKKIKYIDLITYLDKTIAVILREDLSKRYENKPVLIKDFEKYTADEKKAIQDMIAINVIQNESKSLSGNSKIFKGKLNEIIIKCIENLNIISNGNQLVTNKDEMPSNADEYPYIIKGVDKKVYEMVFSKNDEKEYKGPKDSYLLRKDFISQIRAVSEKYYNTLLNINYSTITKEDFKNNLLGELLFSSDDDKISNYINFVKQNQIIIEGKTTYQEPIIYFDGLYYRARLKLDFTIKNTKTRENILYLDTDSSNGNVKYDNDTYSVYIDAYMSVGYGNRTLYIDETPIISSLTKGQENTMTYTNNQ